MRVVTREEWGGPVSIGAALRVRTVALVVVHHTASRALDPLVPVATEATQMRAWQDQHRRQGWAGIGYSFVIFPSGRVYEGRGYGRVGAHAPGANSTSVGIAFALDSRTDAPTTAALASFRELRWDAVTRGHLTAEHRVAPHNAFVPGTACPGPKLLALLPVLAAPSSAADQPRPVLRRGDRGAEVRALQDALVRHGYLTDAEVRTGPGIFGPQTEAAVRRFQQARGLVVDAVVGAQTWSALA